MNWLRRCPPVTGARCRRKNAPLGSSVSNNYQTRSAPHHFKYYLRSMLLVMARRCTLHAQRRLGYVARSVSPVVMLRLESDWLVGRGMNSHQPLQALKEGSVRYDHLRVVDNATRDLPEEQQSEAAELLTTLACQASVQQVRQAGEHLRSVVNPDGSLAKAEQDFSRRRLHLSPLLDGMVALDGLLDAESAATLNAALTPFLVPAGSEDHRSTPQRRADGLIQLADLAMTQADLPVSGGTRPQLTLVCPSTTLTATTTGTGGPESGVRFGCPTHPAEAQSSPQSPRSE